MNIYVGERRPIAHGDLIDAAVRMIAAAVDETATDPRATRGLVDGATMVLLALGGLKTGIDALEQQIAARP